MRHYAGLFASVNAGKRSIELDLKDGDDRDARDGAGAWRPTCSSRDSGPGCWPGSGSTQTPCAALNPGIVYCSISGYGQDDPRALLPGHDVNYQAWAGALTPEGGTATSAAAPDRGPGRRDDRGLRDLRRRPGPKRHGRRRVPRRLDDRRAGHLDGPQRKPMATAAGGSSTTGPVPGYGLFETADGGQVALGVLSEQHFWSSLCAELGLDHLSPWLRGALDAWCGDAARRRRAIDGRRRDELVAALAAAAVPVAPVLDRQGMLDERAVPGVPDPAPAARGSTGPRPAWTSTAARASRPDDTDRRTPRRQPGGDAARGAGPTPDPPARRRHLHGRPHRRVRRSGPPPRRGTRHPQCGGPSHRRRAAQPGPLERRPRGRHRGRHATHPVRSGGASDAELRARTGADLGFLPIDDHAAALRADIERLSGTPYLSALRTIAGLVYDVESGRVEDVVRWERAG